MKPGLLQNEQFCHVFLTKKSLEKLTAQDSGHFVHTGLQGLFVWAGQVGLVLSEQPHRPLCVCITKYMHLLKMAAVQHVHMILL